MKALVAWAAFVGLLFATSKALAEPRVEVRANLDRDIVEVGDIVTYAVQILVHDATSARMPPEPSPGPTTGFSVLGKSSSPIHMNNNGVVDDILGLTTSWSLRADRMGTFTLGPATAVVGATRQKSPAVRVKVLEHGKAPRKRPNSNPFSIDPFGSGALDPFSSLFGFGDDDDRPKAQAAPTADPKLALDAPLAPVAFLHATLDKTRAVVGEQVTFEVYLYEDPYVRQGEAGDRHEATATDFVKHSLMEDETHTVSAGTAMVGGRLWNVTLLRKNALFPFKTGHLTLDPMSITLPHVQPGRRASELLAVDVVEPPAAGRPPGYMLGDVGDMSLQATVTPRTTTQDGAIGVTVELRGTGNLPSQLALPIVPGVEWLEPQLHDKLGPTSSAQYGGTRTFSYVVRMHTAGTVDLGEIKLPYYEPRKGTYATARGSLGIVQVSPGTHVDRAPEKAEPLLDGMPSVRREREARAERTFVTERVWFWPTVFGSPLACGLALAGAQAGRRLRERRAQKTASPQSLATERCAEADLACQRNDGKAAMRAIARAIEASVLSQTRVNVRGVDRASAIRELEDAGLDSASVEAIVAWLRSCDDASFSPVDFDIKEARKTWSEAKETLSGWATRKTSRASGRPDA
jgi:hypothetical protein